MSASDDFWATTALDVGVGDFDVGTVMPRSTEGRLACSEVGRSRSSGIIHMPEIGCDAES